MLEVTADAAQPFAVTFPLDLALKGQFASFSGLPATKLLFLGNSKGVQAIADALWAAIPQRAAGPAPAGWPERLIGYTELQTDLPGGRHANVRTMRATVVKADGTGRRHVAADLATAKATNVTAVERVSFYNGGLFFWPSDPTKLGFTALIDGNSHPFRMDRDGRNKVDLTKESKEFAYGLSSSRDGKRIAYHKSYQVFLADADGANAVHVPTGQPFNFAPTWSPDGKWLLFGSKRGGVRQLYVMRLSDRSERRITTLATGRRHVAALAACRGAGAADLRLHRPTPQNVVLVTDAPWEGNGTNYVTVFQDGAKYRMYYRGSHYSYLGGKDRPNTCDLYCYAESPDGIHWTKPELGLFAWNGSKQNNIVWDGVGGHAFVPFRDTNPKCAADAACKALGVGGGKHGLYAFKSADGIHWTLMHPEPVNTKGAFDSQNLAFWDAQRGEYREYHRDFRDGRDIRTSTSQDFLHWTEPADPNRRARRGDSTSGEP